MKFSNEQVRQMRELANMGMRRREICLKFQISGGQLDRILAGTSRLGAGGAITDGSLPDRRPDIEKINEMTPQQLSEMIQRNNAVAGEVKPIYIPELERQREKPDYSLEGIKRKLAELKAREETPVMNVTAPTGIPLPPDWMQDYGGQDERRPNDPNDLLDELMKK